MKSMHPALTALRGMLSIFCRLLILRKRDASCRLDGAAALGAV